jgi:ribosomal protein S18 acetylase RimI-like enzyme
MITTTYLRLSKASFLTQAPKPHGEAKKASLEKAESFVSGAAMYAAVGKAHYWNIYRLGWDSLHWARYFKRPDIQIAFICDEQKQKIGYLELQIHKDFSIEIVNFGLLPEFIGQGFGRSALESVLGHCFDMSAEEVWLHTCSLDHPLALKNYYARGFALLREESNNYIPLDPEPTLDVLADTTWTTRRAPSTPLRTSNEQRYSAHAG